MNAALDVQRKAVFERAEQLVCDTACGEEQRDLLLAGLEGLRASAAASESQPWFIELPLSVVAAVRGRVGDEALSIAAVATLLYVAIDALDDVMDQDDSQVWADSQPGEVLRAQILSDTGQTIVPTIRAGPAEPYCSRWQGHIVGNHQ